MNFTIVKADLKADRDNIKNFWKIHFPYWPQTKYAWFYEENLYGPASCWIARDSATGNILGTTAIFPKKILVDGQPAIGAIAGDLGVNKKYRNLGIAKMLQRASVEYFISSDLDFLYGTPNIVSEQVCKNAGFEIIGRTVRMVKIIRSHDYIKRVVKIPFLSKILARPVDEFLKFFSEERRMPRPDKFSAELLEDFDDRFDLLWQKMSDRHRMIGERTRQFLHFRFTQCPFKDFEIFALSEQPSGNMLGYIISRLDQKNLHISDILTIDSEIVLDRLIAEFLTFYRKYDIDIITLTYFGKPDIIDRFRRFGFSTRPDNRTIIIYINHNSPYFETLTDAKNWHFLEGDNDA